LDKSTSNRIVKAIAMITILAVTVQLFLFVNVFTNTSNAAFSEIPNDDGTTTATWTFDDPVDYIMHNTTINDSHVALELQTYNWTQYTQQDFNNTAKDNITISAGEVRLSIIEEELIANENFTTDSDWNFINSANGNITSEWSYDENAWMHHCVLKTVEINVATAEGTGDGTGSEELPEVIQTDNNEYYALQQDDDIHTTSFNVSGVNGTIVKVVLWGQYKIVTQGGTPNYNGDDNLRYRNSSFGAYQDSNINSTDADRSDTNRSHDITWLYTIWNWTKVWDIETEFNNTDESPGSDEVWWDRIWLNVTYIPIESFNQTAYVNQTIDKPESIDAQLNFSYCVENVSDEYDAELIVKIDDDVVWLNKSLTISEWIDVSVNVSAFIFDGGSYTVSLQLHLNVSASIVNCSVRYDNISIRTLSYAPKGSILSSVYNADSSAIWEFINWTEELQQGTDIYLETRTGNTTDTSNNSWSEWITYTNASGEVLQNPNAVYIQYRANLTAANRSNTPTLYFINIRYSKYALNGTVETKDFIPENVINWGFFSSIEDLNAQNITYYCSLDSGENWFLMPENGDLRFIETASGAIRFRADLSTFDTAISPTIEAMSLKYVSSNPTGPVEQLYWLWLLVIPLIAILAYAAYRKKFPKAIIEEVFLIYKNGCLIAHNTRRLKPDIDDDVLSAMLTAVQDFIKDSFKDENYALKKLEFGEKKLLIERGKNVYIAVVYAGKKTDIMVSKMKGLIGEIEEKYHDTLEDWDGDLDRLRGAREALKELFK
jgi:hypothetical protein